MAMHHSRTEGEAPPHAPEAPAIIRRIREHAPPAAPGVAMSARLSSAQGVSAVYRAFERETRAAAATLAAGFGDAFVSVKTYFDADDFCASVGAVGVLQGTLPSLGSLRLSFDFYAKIFSPNKQFTRHHLTYDEIRHANTTMSLGEFWFFAHDFDIVPRLLQKADVQFVWNRGRATGADGCHAQELDFDQFVVFLTQLALLAFARPAVTGAADVDAGGGSDTEVHAISDMRSELVAVAAAGGERVPPAERVRMLVRHMRLDNLAWIKHKLATQGRQTAGRLNYQLPPEVQRFVTRSEFLRKRGGMLDEYGVADDEVARTTRWRREALADYTPEMAQVRYLLGCWHWCARCDCADALPAAPTSDSCALRHPPTRC